MTKKVNRKKMPMEAIEQPAQEKVVEEESKEKPEGKEIEFYIESPDTNIAKEKGSDPLYMRVEEIAETTYNIKGYPGYMIKVTLKTCKGNVYTGHAIWTDKDGCDYSFQKGAKIAFTHLLKQRPNTPKELVTALTRAFNQELGIPYEMKK